MKKLLFIFALFFSHSFLINAQKDKLDQLFEKYQEEDGVTSIKIAKPMFNMLNKLNIADNELGQIKPLLSKINGLKILIVEKPDGQISENHFQKLQADIASSIKNMKYEELITVNSKDNKIKFLSSDAVNGILDNLLLSINADGNSLLMMLDGKISMEDVNALINEAEKSTTKSSISTENKTSTGVTQVRNVGQFTGISVSSGIKVNFTQGNNQSVVVDTDPNMQQYISTEVENGILVIKVQTKDKKNLNFKKLLVTVEAPRLSSVKVSSGSLFTTLNRISEDNFKADISSGANLNADLNIKNTVNVDISSGSSMKMDVKTKTFEFEGSSGSSSTVVGNAENVIANLSSAASCNAQDLISKNSTARTSSGASLKINTTVSLNAVSTSGSSIRYKGNPKNIIETGKSSSGGSVKPLN